MTFLCPCVFKCSTLGHNKYDWVISELSVLPELRTLYGFKECPPWFDDPRPAASVCLECSSRWGLARFPLPFEMTSQPSLDRASRASSLLIPWRLTTLISAISDWFVGVASSQKDRGFETWQIIKGSPLHLWYVDKERTEQMGTSESLLPRTHILLIFSLMRDFRRLLENTLNLFQRSLQQSFLLHCSMLGQTLKLQSLYSFIFFDINYNSGEWKLCVQGCRWNREDPFSACISSYGNRAPTFSESKMSSAVWQIWVSSWKRLFGYLGYW